MKVKLAVLLALVLFQVPASAQQGGDETIPPVTLIMLLLRSARRGPPVKMLG